MCFTWSRYNELVNAQAIVLGGDEVEDQGMVEVEP